MRGYYCGVFCENVVANSIMGYYALKAKKYGIPFHCICAIPKRISIKGSDLCVVLGNALENAMEACERLDGLDMRTISGEVRIVNGQLLIIIKNLFNGLLILTDGSYLSAKNSCAHGLGLRSIQMVVDGCGGFLKTEHSGKRFTLMAAFPNTNSDEPPDVSQGSS